MPDAQDLPVSLAQALCVYAEPLVIGRRVVVVGDASKGLGERLLQLGARTVHVYHSSFDGAPAVALDIRGLVVRDLPTADFDVRDGAFDVALIPDLGHADARGDLLARVRRLVARGGAILVGAANPAGRAALSVSGSRPLDYYELYDRVALQFSHVRMIAQVPFAGVVLADLGLEGAVPEVSVDTQLIFDPEAPEWFFALAGQEEIRLADYAIVQLPDAAVHTSRGDANASAERVRVALAEAQLRAALLEAQLDDLRQKAQHPPLVEEASVDLPARVAELEQRFAEEAARRRDAEARAAEHYARAERLANEGRELASELRRQGDRASALDGALGGAESALGALRARLAEAEEGRGKREVELALALVDLERARQSAAEAEDELTRAESTDERAAVLAAEVALLEEGHVADVAQLEQALRERARAVRELEHEVSRRERIIQELLAAFEEAKSPPDPRVDAATAVRDAVIAKGESDTLQRELEIRVEAANSATERAAVLAAANDELRAKLDALAMDIARREGASVESAWRISELEQQIARLEAEHRELTVTIAPPKMPDAGPDLAQAERVSDLQNELDVLRQALAQEHDARVRAELARPHEPPGSADSVDSSRA
jgi:chromosome segregation ATPase